MQQAWSRRLSPRFFERPADRVAPDLLGCYVVRQWRGAPLVGRIVETEAYLPHGDAACHASRGRTPRNEVLFGPPGRAYVYFIYGMYDMLNVVCDVDGVPAAVLVRAVEPVWGADRMQRWRPVSRPHMMANGPGKLCRAYRITRRLNRHDLQEAPLWIASGKLQAEEDMQVSARIGVDYAGEDALLPLRYFIRGHRHVSPGRPSG